MIIVYLYGNKNCYGNICNRISEIQTAMQARVHIHYLFCRFSFHPSSLSLRSYPSIDPYPQIFELEFISKNSRRSSPQYFHRGTFFLYPTFFDTSDDTSTRIVTLPSRYIVAIRKRETEKERERENYSSMTRLNTVQIE